VQNSGVSIGSEFGMANYDLKTPFGIIRITSNDLAITGVEFLKSGSKSKKQSRQPLLTLCKKQLEEYFAGKRTEFDLPIHPEGTEFQKTVWQNLVKIPYGKTISYSDLARCIGNAKACRAVGGANNKNPLPILIPCHRVVGKNGDLVGFAGRLDIKKWLLEHECRVAQLKDKSKFFS
jgi:methylated-DNA-[protein]-cysteine S-methyltransferase